MARYPDMVALSRLSKLDFSDINSLEQINRREKGRFEKGYPARETPEWWALRKRYEEILLGDIRKARRGQSSVNEPEAEAAKWAALGNELADEDYQHFAPVDTNAPDCRRRKDWLDVAADAVRP